MIIVVLLLVYFILSLWLTSLVAKALGAGNASILRVFFALLLSGLVMIPIAFILPNPVLLIIGSMVATTAILAKMLDMTMVGGFLVYIANAVIGVVLSLIMFVTGLGFGGLEFFEEFYQWQGQADIAQVERSAEAVCACGTDESCLLEEYIEHAQILGNFLEEYEDENEFQRAQHYALRAESCIDDPRNYVPVALVEDGNVPRRRGRRAELSDEQREAAENIFNVPAQVQDLLPEEAAPEVVEEKEEIKPSYRAVALDQLPLYERHRVRATRKDQKQFVGRMSMMPNGDVRLMQRKMGGEFGVVIPRRQLVQLEVYQVWADNDSAADGAEDSNG
ncbi:MAG: hypothetical protein MI750_15030 [Xanthomonadales bacterium]|nr:hypothetical protein [Xanthomonadales bacterium]